MEVFRWLSRLLRSIINVFRSQPQITAADEVYDEAKFKFINGDEFDELIKGGMKFEKLLEMEEKRKEKAKKLKESYDPQKYLALTKCEWDKFVEDGYCESKLKEIHEERLAEIDKRMAIYNLKLKPKTTDIYFSDKEMRIVLIGKTGEGKSAVGNSVLRKSSFEDDLRATSVTGHTKEEKTTWNNITIRVVDTPGLQDTNKDQDETMKEIARVVQYYPDGIHAFLFVQNLTHRVTKADRQVLYDVTDQFGEEVLKHLILVFTHADDDKDFDMSTYISKNTKKEEDEHSKFLKELGWKVLALNNKACTEYEKQQNQNRIISHVVAMVHGNVPKYVYTNELFDMVQKERLNALQSALSIDTMEYIKRHPEVTDSPRVPDDLLSHVKRSCKEAKGFGDDALRAAMNTEITKFRRENEGIRNKINKSESGCFIS